MSRHIAIGVAIGMSILACGERLGRVVSAAPPFASRAQPEVLGQPPLPPQAQLTGSPLTLEQALTTALANSDVVRLLDGGVASATTYDPAIADQQRQAALAAFDTSLESSFYWNRFDGPPNAFFGPGLDRQERLDEATFQSALTKRWALGTETRVAYSPSPGYLYYPQGASGFNPNHVAALELGVRQPLLRGAGRAVNTAPITIAQLRTDQSSWEFKRALLALMRSVEQAYWELQAARVAEEAIAQQIVLIDAVVRVEQANLSAQRAVLADVAKARTQQHAFRQRLVAAQRFSREQELQLRSLLKLDPSDGLTLIPVTPPTRAPLTVDPASVLATALEHQPDLIRARIQTRIRELELGVFQNRFRPQLDLLALYRANGLSDDLDESLAMMLRQDYQDWQFGAVFSMPLGRNADRAQVRAAELTLQRQHALLRESVRTTLFQLNEVLVRIQALHIQHQEAEAQAVQAQEWLRGARIRFENPPPAGDSANWLLLALDDYILAMQATAGVTAESSSILARYNTELARLQELEGTLLSTFNIHLDQDPCADSVVGKLPKVDLEKLGLLSAVNNSPPSLAPLPTIPGAITPALALPAAQPESPVLTRLPKPGEGEGSLIRLPPLDEEILKPEPELAFEPHREPAIIRLPPPEFGA